MCAGSEVAGLAMAGAVGRLARGAPTATVVILAVLSMRPVTAAVVSMAVRVDSNSDRDTVCVLISFQYNIVNTMRCSPTMHHEHNHLTCTCCGELPMPAFDSPHEHYPIIPRSAVSESARYFEFERSFAHLSIFHPNQELIVSLLVSYFQFYCLN